ncbi:MAG: hypothetical protein IJS07_01915, partial [Bacteroidales bacterium]|nr:hypothetical protein [Bacteroidales bacterium]
MTRKLITILLFTLSLCACGEMKEGPENAGSDMYVLCDAFFGEAELGQYFTDESRIGVWNADGKNLPFRKSSAEGATRLSFRGDSDLKSTSYVCSPFNPDDAADGSVYSINTPDSYTWNGEGLCSDIPMFGSTRSNVVLLSPLCGVVDIPVVGGCRFRKLQFTPLERDRYASGRYLVDTNDPEAVQNAVFEGRSRSVIVSCDKVISLNYSDTLHVFFPLPAQEYREYELAVETEDGEPVILQVTGDTLKVQRGRIASAAPVRLKDIQPIQSFCFGAKANARINADIPLTIDHASHEITVRIDKYVGLNGIIPTFTLSEGCKAYVNGALQESGVSVQNFYHPVVYTIEDSAGLKTSYTVRVSHFTGLPVIFINTPDSREITSRDEWMEGVSMRIDGIGEFDDYETPSDDPAFIKGRGNATWVKFPKKAFNMKLGERATILGMPAHKRWCFIANYRDRTRMGNRLSYYIASHLSGLDWT